MGTPCAVRVGGKEGRREGGKEGRRVESRRVVPEELVGCRVEEDGVVGDSVRREGVAEFAPDRAVPLFVLDVCACRE